ncbi:hypothetical protein MNV_80014 [Candidatus Methanoperedens nitroreducens]|uniref:Uncharacterized protein n=1 Tax=Candidatus Methanoperedens nitratireducens TaxID=1392998 RepID=A0A284VTW3_9EURY|nr:hypothetical protein MNV_80014 [Candidatus Methanoperedens nitroreducens]
MSTGRKFTGDAGTIFDPSCTLFLNFLDWIYRIDRIYSILPVVLDKLKRTRMTRIKRIFTDTKSVIIGVSRVLSQQVKLADDLDGILSYRSRKIYK